MSNYTTIPSNTTNPYNYKGFQESYNEIMSNRGNPFYNQAKGVYDTWADLLKGTQWKNNQLSNLFNTYSNINGNNSGNSGSGKGGITTDLPSWMKFYEVQGPQYKNFANIMNRAFSTAGQIQNLGDQALKNVISDISKSNKYTTQENELITNLLGGDYLQQLKEPLSQYKQSVSGNIANLSTGLAGERNSFADKIRSIISGEESARAGTLAELQNAYNNLLSSQKSDIARREAETQRALQNSAEVGIRKGMDALNAGMFKNRLPDTSYARQAMLIGSENLADIAKQMENLKWQNYNTMSGFERQLPQLYSNIELQNIADIANQRQAAETGITQMGRSDLSTIAGLQNALADALYKGNTSAIMSNQNLINSLLGARSAATQKQIANELLPMQVAQQNANAQLGIAANIGQTLPMYESIYSDFSERFTPTTYYPNLPYPYYRPAAMPIFPQYDTTGWNQSANAYQQLMNQLSGQRNNFVSPQYNATPTTSTAVNQFNSIARPIINTSPQIDVPPITNSIYDILNNNWAYV